MTRARSWVERRPSSASRTTAASADTSRVQLKSLGYKVVPAASATEALAIAADGTPFDLLFTDIVMPGGINGRELAEQMVAARPSLRVLFTSGYAHDSRHAPGGITMGAPLLTKPYRKAELEGFLRKQSSDRDG